MNTEIVNDLKRDSNTIKFGETGSEYFQFGNDPFVVLFLYEYYVMSVQSPFKFENRIKFNLIPLDKFNINIPRKQIELNTLILVNANRINYELTYSINIDKTNKLLSIKIEHLPELGLNLISDDEKKGITLKYNYSF